MDSKEQNEKFWKYEAEFKQYLMSKYFSDKTIFGGNMFDVKMNIDGQTIAASRLPPYQSYLNPPASSPPPVESKESAPAEEKGSEVLLGLTDVGPPPTAKAPPPTRAEPCRGEFKLLPEFQMAIQDALTSHIQSPGEFAEFQMAIQDTLTSHIQSPGEFAEFQMAIQDALTSQNPVVGNDMVSLTVSHCRQQIELLYETFLVNRELAAWREAQQKKLAAANSEVAEAVRFRASAEEEAVRLRGLLREEEAKMAELRKARNDAEEARNDVDDLYLSLLVKSEDFRASFEQRRTALEGRVADLEAKVAELTSQNQELQTTIAQLKRGEGIDWIMAIDCKDFDPVRDCIYSMAVTAAREAVQERYPNLNLDFLEIEVEDAEDTLSPTCEGGARG